MLTRQRRRWTASLALAIFLFAQGVTAWSACDWLENSPYLAVLAAAEVAPCHESGFGGACLTHCLSDRQAVQKVPAEIPAMPAAPVLTHALTIGDVRNLRSVPVPERAAGASPPRRILLQSFQV